MSSEFETIFVRLRRILQEHAGTFSVSRDAPDCYGLEGMTGSAAVEAWGGKVKRRTIPVAWVQIGKAYVSYHLMGIHGNGKLLEGMSKELKARMQGKTCFNFKKNEEALFRELEELTVEGLAAFKRAGYIAENKST